MADQFINEATIEYPDGRYSYPATAVHAPGEIVTRPSGTLAIYDGINSCAVGQVISPQPLHPRPSGVFKAASAGTWAAGAQVYWDAADNEINNSATDNTLVGRAIEAKTSGQTTNRVELTLD